jgi:hypothetical protein
VVDDELLVEPDADAGADHDDAEGVPFAERFVGEHERVFAGSVGRIVPEPAGAFVGADTELGGFRVVPDLDLWNAAEVDAGIGFGDGAVFDEQFEVAVILLGGGIGAVAVVDEFVILGAPVFPHGAGPFGDLGVAVRGRHRQQFPVVEGIAAAPAGEVFAVKQGFKTGRWGCGLGAGREDRRCEQQSRQPDRGSATAEGVERRCVHSDG